MDSRFGIRCSRPIHFYAPKKTASKIEPEESNCELYTIMQKEFESTEAIEKEQDQGPEKYDAVFHTTYYIDVVNDGEIKPIKKNVVVGAVLNEGRSLKWTRAQSVEYDIFIDSAEGADSAERLIDSGSWVFYLEHRDETEAQIFERFRTEVVNGGDDDGFCYPD